MISRAPAGLGLLQPDQENRQCRLLVRGRGDWVLWLCAVLVAVEAVVVLAVIKMGAHSILGGDGEEYERYAINIVGHHVFSNAIAAPFYSSVFRTPGYPLFLAVFRWIAPGSLLVVRVVQFMLLALTSYLVYRVALFVATRRAAVASAVICATFLPLVWVAAFHQSEVLATSLAVCVVLLIFEAMRMTRSWRSALVIYGMVGLATGLLSLVRPEDGLVVVPISIGLFLADRRHTIRKRVPMLGLLLVAFVVIMAPWTIRNAIDTHRFLPFGTSSGESLYMSAQQYAGRISYAVWPNEFQALWGAHGEFEQITGRSSPFASPVGGVQVELASNDAILAAAERIFRSLSIGQVVTSLPSRVAHLWGTADSPPSGRFFTVAHRLAVVQYALILILAAVGLVTSAVRLGARIWPLLLFPVYTTAVHLVFNVEARFTIPDRPFLIIFAGIGLVQLLDSVGRRRGATRPARARRA